MKRTIIWKRIWRKACQDAIQKAIELGILALLLGGAFKLIAVAVPAIAIASVVAKFTALQLE